MKEKVNFSFLYVHMTPVFHRWEMILMTQSCWFMLPQQKVTSLVLFLCMIKIHYTCWGNHQSIGTHLPQDNSAPEILLMTSIFNWIAGTEYTQAIFFPSFIILASIIIQTRLPLLEYDRHFRISLTHEYKQLYKNKFFKTRAGNKKSPRDQQL